MGPYHRSSRGRLSIRRRILPEADFGIWSMNSRCRMRLCGATRAATQPMMASDVVARAASSPLEDDVRLGHLARLLVRLAHHGGVEDGGMRDQQRLELGGRHLQPLVLDQLLGAIDDEEEPLVVDVSHVAGVVPAFPVEAIGGLLGPAQIPLHDLRPADPQLALRALGDRSSPETTSTIFTSVFGTTFPAEPGFIGSWLVGLRCVTGLASVMP